MYKGSYLVNAGADLLNVCCIVNAGAYLVNAGADLVNTGADLLNVWWVLLNKSVYLLNYVETLIKESVYLVGKGVHLLYRASVANLTNCHTFFRVLAQRAPHRPSRKRVWYTLSNVGCAESACLENG